MEEIPATVADVVTRHIDAPELIYAVVGLATGVAAMAVGIWRRLVPLPKTPARAAPDSNAQAIHAIAAALGDAQADQRDMQRRMEDLERATARVHRRLEHRSSPSPGTPPRRRRARRRALMV